MITEFVNREVDMEFLEKRYKSGEFEFIPIYGRRRVGKTELILNFIKGRKAIYFQAVEGTKKENIEKFKEAAAPIIDLKFVKDDWETIFEYIKTNVKERIVVVIDEFPYLVGSEQGLSSIFQKIIDIHLKDSKIFLILCGSSLSMMYKEVLAYRAPLYGRRTGQLEIKTLGFFDATRFFDKALEEIINIYSICGGIPAYLKEFVEGRSLFELIKEKVLVRGSLLREEVLFLLREEFRDPKVYLSILSALALGYRKLGEIINYCGFKDKTSITPYLSNLESLGYISREIPITEKPLSKKGLYFINDIFFNFWLRMVRKNFDIIEKDVDTAIKKVKKDFNLHVSSVFEEICKQFLWKVRPINFDKLGREWGKTKGRTGPNVYEIDLVGFNDQTKEILFCECKWQDKVNPEKVLEELKEKVKFVDWNTGKRKEHYCIIAKSFSKRTKDALLFDLKDIEKLLI